MLRVGKSVISSLGLSGSQYHLKEKILARQYLWLDFPSKTYSSQPSFASESRGDLKQSGCCAQRFVIKFSTLIRKYISCETTKDQNKTQAFLLSVPVRLFVQRNTGHTQHFYKPESWLENLTVGGASNALLLSNTECSLFSHSVLESMVLCWCHQ